MRRLLLGLAVAIPCFLSGTAKADTFNFSAVTLGTSVSGVLTATNNNSGAYSVTSITGTGITGLVAAGDPFFGNDNLIFPSSTRFLDVNGLAYTQLIGGQLYSLDVYSTVSGFQVLALDSNNNLTFDTASFSVSSTPTVTPEPSGFILVGTGLLGVVASVRRRRIA